MELCELAQLYVETIFFICILIHNKVLFCKNSELVAKQDGRKMGCSLFIGINISV